MSTVDFASGIRNQFDLIQKTAPNNEVESKCYDIVTSQKTGIDIVKAGKIFDEIFKKNKIPKFPISFGKETLYLKGYYKFALVKDSGTFKDCINESLEGAEDSKETGINLSVISRSDLSAVLNALYDETRICDFKIDTIRLLEVANYLKADTLAQKLLNELEKCILDPFSSLLHLCKRINSSPIRHFLPVQKIIRRFGRRFGEEILRGMTKESREAVIDKLAQAQITSLRIKIKPATHISFTLTRAFISDLNRITSLTELFLPNRVYASDAPLLTFSTKIVSLQLNFQSIIGHVTLPSSLTYLKGHNIDQSHVLSPLTRLIKLSCKSCNPIDLTELTALASLSISFQNHRDIYRVPRHVTKLSYTHCFLDTTSLGELHPSVKKLKLKRFHGTLNDGTRLLGTELTDLAMGGNVSLLHSVTNESIMNLPRSLTRLIILNNSTTNDAYKNLPLLKHLELDVDSRFSNITKEVTPYLPRTLKYLYIANGIFPDEALKHLPQDCKVEMLTKEAARDLAIVQ